MGLGAIAHRLAGQADDDEDLGRVVSVDSTVVRAHQRAVGARRKRAPTGEPPGHANGRSRGGLITKIHFAANGNCRPLAFVLTAGQAGDAPAMIREALPSQLRPRAQRAWHGPKNRSAAAHAGVSTRAAVLLRPPVPPIRKRNLNDEVKPSA
ncbi:transposase [Streptomyces sp. NPDC057249]|uniref:transposase n=1 Tax=Streptomyces sp. NPDC057249 TaxID=3346067 RepID=UPI00363FADDA